MEVIGTVTKTDGSLATVLIENTQSCDSCEFAKFCRIDKKSREIICRNLMGAKEGDIVQLDTSNKSIVTATILNFIFPLLFLVGGVATGIKIWQTELAGFLSGMSSMVFYFTVFLFVDKKILKRSPLLPEVISIKKTNPR
jgi:sigma-E factor negative regulatory protein RseC